MEIKKKTFSFSFSVKEEHNDSTGSHCPRDRLVSEGETNNHQKAKRKKVESAE